MADDLAWEKLKTIHEMTCDRELSFFGCRDCDFFYETEYKTIDCLKKNILTWTLYRIEKQGEKR